MSNLIGCDRPGCDQIASYSSDEYGELCGEHFFHLVHLSVTTDIGEYMKTPVRPPHVRSAVFQYFASIFKYKGTRSKP